MSFTGNGRKVINYSNHQTRGRMNHFLCVPLILLMLILQVCRVANDYCHEAVKSVIKVESCPTTNQEWENAANLKNCNITAAQQKCTDADIFVYHCVINGFENETLEVCAPQRLITGHCTEFNVDGGVIQIHYPTPCGKETFPNCSKTYKSSEAYKYQGCYELVYIKKGENSTIIPTNKPSTSYKPENDTSLISSTAKPEDKTPNEPENSATPTIIAVVLAIALVVCITIAAIYLCIIKKKQKARKSKGTSVDKEEQYSLIQNPVDNEQEQKARKSKGTSVAKEEQYSLIQNPVDNEQGRKRPNLKYPEVVIGADKYAFAMVKTFDDLRDENKDESKRYLKYYQRIDQYFCETEMYKTAEAVFIKNGIVVFTGPPGCGKTMAAVHLIRKELHNWTFRKIYSLEELSFIDEDKKSLVFIDNIFFRRTMDSDLGSWWDTLDRIYEKYFASYDIEDKSKRLRIVMTARSNVIEKACTYMGKVTPILHEIYLINAGKLAENEKDEILEKQIQFAKREKGGHVPLINDIFKEQVKKTEGPIGFPLCAHLYVFGEEYQKSGATFFSKPIELLKRQIGDEIASDKTNRTKSLFFFMCFFEWHTKLGKFKKIDLKGASSCKEFLNKISPDLVKNFYPFDFNGLEEKAQKLSGTFFKEVGEHKYKFVHDSVFEAVGAYFCETNFTETAKHFPLDLIQNQDYENLTKSQKVTLSTRLLYEALDQRLSEVFACKIFREEEFSTLFYSELKKKDNNTVDLFLTVTNESSIVKLPTIFWTSCYNIFPLTELLYELVKKRNISPKYQLYVLLFGMCCARSEGVLKTVNGMFRDNIEMLKNRVLAFEDDEGNFIPHIIIASKSSDELVLNALKEFFEEKKSIAMERNNTNMTLLMLAVKQKLPRVNVIKYLMDTTLNHLLYKDTNASTVLHHLLGSENDDEKCSQYLDVILSNEKAKKCLPKDDYKGDTALSIAANEIKHSRIWSMLKLLESGECIVDSLNQKGCSPLHLSASSLKGDTPYLKLECCTRVIILLLYGANPKKQTDKSDEPVDECKYEGVRTILKNPLDLKAMENVLDGYVKDVDNLENCKEMKKVELNISETLSPGIHKGIIKAVQYLKNIEL